MVKIRFVGKRGISPLIATVLIIGFVIALAAIIMTWGTSFTRDIQQTTEEGASTQITCSQDVVFKITNVCDVSTLNGIYKITIQNDGTKLINSFNVRYFEAADDVTQQSVTFGGNGIPAFGIEADNTVESGQTAVSAVKKIEAIPVVTINNKAVTCSANIRDFGSLDGNAIPLC
jgi:flagellin-like protein